MSNFSLNKLTGSLALTAGLLMLPAISQASPIQQFDGSESVYMDYANGKDELLVNNFNTDLTLSFDIYQSATPDSADSWTLDRSYTSEDFSEINTDNFYSLNTSAAVRYNGDWYFSVVSQSAGEYTTLPETIEVWRITNRGAKPEQVLSIASESSAYFAHSPVFIWHDQLVFIDTYGLVYTSTDGTTWSEGTTVSALQTGYGYDVVSNGDTIYLAVNESVYRSTDLINWTSIGDLCSAVEETCFVSQLALRPNKGIFAVTSVDYLSYPLWVYKKGTWSNQTTFTNYVNDLKTFGSQTSALLSRGNAGYQYSISTVAPDGSAESLVKKHDASPMGLLSAKLLITNPKNASYVNLVGY